MREQFLAKNQPIISVDAKKREQIGNFKNPGTTWTIDPVQVKDHDFPEKEGIKIVPYGIYDVQKNDGMVVIGESANTAEFAVTSIVKWWEEWGQKQWPGAKELLILADGGGGNGSRSRMWKYALQCDFVDKFGIEVTVCHYPPGTSKWNPVEHRLFGPLSNTWAGIPLRSIATVIDCVEKTTTKTGLKLQALHLTETFERGVKVSDDEMNSIDINRHTKCSSWNYTLIPPN